MTWDWLTVAALAWLVVALVAAGVIGRTIRGGQGPDPKPRLHFIACDVMTPRRPWEPEPECTCRGIGE